MPKARELAPAAAGTAVNEGTAGTAATAGIAGWRPDPDRQLSLLFDVFAAGQHTRRLLETALAGCGLRPDEYAAYSVVFESESVTMTEMARQLGMPVTTAADYVRTMRARGHLRRDAHPGDSRAYLLALTASGLRAHRRASAAFSRGHEALLAELAPATEDALRAVLGQLSAAAQAATAVLDGSADPQRSTGLSAMPRTGRGARPAAR